MEQEKKNCPYCGEEIMASAKKCKHCGEWLIKTPSPPSPPKQPVRKESYFGPKYKYDSTWMSILFWVTITGAFIQALYNSEIADGIVVSGNIITKFILATIKFFSIIPEVMGDFLFTAGEITFMYLLMKAMSNFHKPLKEIFVANIVIIAVIELVYIIIDDNMLDLTSIILILFLSILLPTILGVQIITNYEGIIKDTGWVIIIYPIVSVAAAILGNYLAFPVLTFLLSFLPDYFYFKYFQNLLSNN